MPYRGADNKMRYILFGTGVYYTRFFHWFAKKNVVAILDNDKKKQGEILDGHIVVSPEKIVEYSYDVIVILSFYIAEIKKQLVELGVSEDKIFHFYDLYYLFAREQECKKAKMNTTILLLSHDLSLGGPAIALYNAALILKRAGYEVVYGSMIDGELRSKLENDYIPVIVDERLQIYTMNDLLWTQKYDLIFCNTINYHVFLSDRDSRIPVIWWLHDSSFFYDGIKPGRLATIDTTNIKFLSVGPVPKLAMQKFNSDVKIDDLVYGVSNDI